MQASYGHPAPKRKHERACPAPPWKLREVPLRGGGKKRADMGPKLGLTEILSQGSRKYDPTVRRSSDPPLEQIKDHKRVNSKVQSCIVNSEFLNLGSSDMVDQIVLC
jgi:hypothetical protein